ncbi:MAG: xylose isomerase [Planctomycetota bacterium]
MRGDAFDPTPADHFSFGLWTVGNRGRDPFGEAVRPALDPRESVARLAECGAWGVNLHDEDLVPFGSTPRERDRIVAGFQKALKDHGLVVPMATTNLFSHPVFKDGAFTSSDPSVRAFALRKTMDAIDLGAELGAQIYVFWGGREGSESDAARDPRTALGWLRQALDFLCDYVRERGYGLRFALEAKPNEPRGDIYLPTTGHMLAFLETLAHPEMVGVNPEVAHETMAGLSMVHAVAQAMDRGKLFHIDLNAQKIGRYDQDLRFGSEDAKGAFLLVRMLEGTAGGQRAEPARGKGAARGKAGVLPATADLAGRPWPRYEGPRHFDAHAYRSEDQEGVWDFARGCMRSYKILAARAAAFDADPDVRALLEEEAAEHARGAAIQGRATGSRGARGAAGSSELTTLLSGFTPEKAARLRALKLDPAALAARGLRRERLDQLLMEHLLGARGSAPARRARG